MLQELHVIVVGRCCRGFTVSAFPVQVFQVVVHLWKIRVINLVNVKFRWNYGAIWLFTRVSLETTIMEKASFITEFPAGVPKTVVLVSCAFPALFLRGQKVWSLPLKWLGMCQDARWMFLYSIRHRSPKVEPMYHRDIHSHKKWCPISLGELPKAERKAKMCNWLWHIWVHADSGLGWLV